MSSVLVTGASRGIGLEFVRQYAADGWRVFATCRKPGEATALQELARAQAQLSVHPLEVGNSGSVKALAAELASESIDLLINNAGVIGPRRQGFGETDYGAWEDALRVNLIGVMQICEALVENVARSEKKTMVAITSGMGSISDSGGGSYVYRTSKAALNMLMHNIGVDLKSRGVISVVINPGWVKTDMGGSGARLEVHQSVGAMRKVFSNLTLADTGKFLNYNGGSYAW
ncbi:MAG TPA: SDR family oxidoreductase [Polyangiaceae bacterium]|jgi:NAD(P)-dependent dehydrogenase (short-subunit alcohol dehydrogenase family)